MNPPSTYGVQSTAGAVPVRNEKGEISMQKVKVHRYVSGKKPDYAQDIRSDTDTDDEDFLEQRQRNQYNQQQLRKSPNHAVTHSDDNDNDDGISRSIDDDDDDEVNDPRLRRLKIASNDTEIRTERRRYILEPEILESSDDEEEEDDDDDDEDVIAREKQSIHLQEQKHTIQADPDDDDDNREDDDDDESAGELSDSEIERRREEMKKRILNKQQQQQDEEFMIKEEEKSESSDDLQTDDDDDDDDDEEYTDSEEETGPRLKPIFVRKRDRITIVEKEKEIQKQRQLEQEAQRNAEERRRQTLRLVEETIRKEEQMKAKETNEPHINDVCTDDENDELEYEAWKLRELKRIKRDREEREAIEKERLEIERLRQMSEEERRIEMRLNPKIVTNKSIKGKYKFLQKYYHRGAFYLDREDDVYKRDFAQATLEDHFDKTILPKVMQVKNFGRSGRTKYTHLVDQDTTQFDSPWSTETSQNLKFHSHQAGGMKQVFDKPTLKKRKIQ